MLKCTYTYTFCSTRADTYNFLTRKFYRRSDDKESSGDCIEGNS